MGQVQRRKFLIAAGLLLGWPDAARAQAPQHARIGVLSLEPKTARNVTRHSSTMRELGWTEGVNLTVERRFADNQLEKLPELASELVRLGVQVIITEETYEAQVAFRATRSIPIVIVSAVNPVKSGLAQSVARPGGNVTGVMWGDPAWSAKGIQILREAVPGIKRIGILYFPRVGIEDSVDAVNSAARGFGIDPLWFPITHREQLTSVLAEAKKARVDALRIATDIIHPVIDQLLQFAASNKLPTYFVYSAGVDRGGLLSYATLRSQSFARAAAMVDKILKGANPADMPFEYPTRYELVINLKTAKELGVTMPQSLLVRADRVIE